MTLLQKGKTKDVYAHGEHTLELKFTDRVTMNEQGQIDPGGNNVADVTASGQGRACLAMTTAVFEYLTENGIPTHMVSYDLDNLSMVVRKAKVFGPGLEWVCRWVGTGSFVRRYKSLPGVVNGMKFPNPVMEITIKDDAGDDPMIVPSAILALELLNRTELDELLALNKKAMLLIHGLFLEHDLDLWDIKIEWGKDAETGEFLLIDEVSANGCRAFDLASGKRVEGEALSGRFRA